MMALYPYGMDVRPVEKPGAKSLHVALNQVRCPRQDPELKEAAAHIGGEKTVEYQSNSGSRSISLPTLLGDIVDKSAVNEETDANRDPTDSEVKTNTPSFSGL